MDRGDGLGFDRLLLGGAVKARLLREGTSLRQLRPLVQLLEEWIILPALNGVGVWQNIGLSLWLQKALEDITQ